MSLRLLAKRNEEAGTESDQVEKNRAYLENGYDMARWLSARSEHWRLISCTDAAGALRSATDIHKDVYAALEGLLPVSA